MSWSGSSAKVGSKVEMYDKHACKVSDAAGSAISCSEWDEVDAMPDVSACGIAGTALPGWSLTTKSLKMRLLRVRPANTQVLSGVNHSNITNSRLEECMS